LSSIEKEFDMPRLPRLDAQGAAQHVIQRGNNRQLCLEVRKTLQRMLLDMGWRSMLGCSWRTMFTCC